MAQTANKSGSLSRITLVMASTTDGGLEKHVIELAIGLAKRGYQVTVIADSRYQNAFADGAITFSALDFSRSRRNPILLWQLYQAIQLSQPDVIHLHANKAASLYANLVRLGAFKHQACVGSLHSQKSNTKMFKACDIVIAVSQAAKDALGDSHGQVAVILNGIQLPPSLPHTLHEPPVVLTVGRLEAVKGYDVLIKAWQDIPAELWIVGEGGLLAEYQALIAQQPHPVRIKLLGYREDINELMHQASLFVMSSHYEGCPYVMIEALLTDTPMVSTKVGAMADILPQQYLCKINDVNDLHTTIKQTLANLIQTHQDYRPVFEWAKQHLTFDTMVEKIIQVYEEAYTQHS